MLSPYRVLDLTNERGLLCGQILADLGADVIQVEPPGGSSARRLAPFYGDRVHPDCSLHWWSYCRGKRSVAIDLDTTAGQAALRRLVRSAHFLIESGKPGELAARGLGYDDLAALNPGLIYVSISPFGSSGPKAQYADSDLVMMAAGGALVLYGDDDRPPVRIAVPQAYQHAAADAAVAALIAHYERTRSGRGQHVDVSVQQAVCAAMQSTILASAVGFVPAQRVAGGARFGPLTSRMVYPASDGYVSITFLFGASFGPATRRLMELICSEGCCDTATRDKDWVRYLELLMFGEEPFDEYERIKQVVADFTSTRTKDQLLQAAREHALLIAPVATTKEVVESAQLAAREYFQPLHHPEIDAVIRYPGPFARFAAAPIVYRRRPPTIGEHTQEVFAELETVAEPAPIYDAPGPAAASVDAMAGLKVLDLMWAIAGPAATRTLADFGATVVRVESATHVDVCRTIPPFVNAQLGPENSALFHNMNAGKLMLTLDLGKPEARAVILDLVRWADVVTESFSPKAMRAWGLDYQALRKVKPDIIMLSTCLMGQTGPLASFAGFGNLAAAITGFYELCGWPDRPPAGPFGAYTDYLAPRFNAVAILAAVEHRRRTGAGQHIDLSQAEASMHFLSPAILDYVANGRVWLRNGNDDLLAVPHGVYPSAGDDCWVAVAVRSDDQWQSLCAVIGQPQLAHDTRFATAAARRTNEVAIDALIAAWSKSLDMQAAEAALQARGVPASALLNSAELCADPQLRERQHFVTLTHPELGTTCIEGSRFRLSRTPARIGGAAPTLGGDNQYVLEHILGYSEKRITELVVAGALA